MGTGCISGCLFLDFVCERKITHILPNLVMRLVGNNFIIRNVVVLENRFGFWTRRVHILIVGNEEGRIKGVTMGNEEGEGSGSKGFI